MVFIWLPRSCTRLNRLITSILIWNCFPFERPTFLDTDRSVSVWIGVRTSVSTRGALPHVPAGAAVNAAGFSQAAEG